MKQTIQICFVFLLIILFACKSDHTTNEVKDVTIEEPKVKQGPTELIVNLDQLRLREEPGAKGLEVAKLLNGTKLIDLGEVSDFSTKVKLRGINYNEPWIKVKRAEGQEGWVYAGGVTFDLENPTALSQKLQEKRLQSMFGNALTKRMISYSTDYKKVKNSQDFQKLYTESMELRDTLVTLLETKVLIEDPRYMPDLFWLEDVMPGFESAIVAEGTMYYLFRNYKEMLDKTSTTEGMEDDDFTQLCLMVHSTDSVEYFFKSWFMQTWDYGGSSLLGKGIHHDLLTKMDDLLKKSSLFKNEMLAIKAEIMKDITDTYVEYWESQKDILKEIDEIIQSDFDLLDEGEKLALETRRKMFKKYNANKIKLNQRAGY